MDGSLLSKFGNILANYYLDLYSESSSISLFIDKLTFEEICKTSGLDFDACMQCLRIEFPSRRISIDPYKSLAIVAFQIMISNDVNSKGVYDKLRAEIPSLQNVDNTTLMKLYFEEGQDLIWETVYKFFRFQKKEIKSFPNGKKYGTGRYVRYPISQQILRTNQIVAYADKFKQNLEPHKPYTFDEFKKRIEFNFYHYDNELAKHLIFSFYQTWDGQATLDYKNQRTHKRDKQTVTICTETVLEVFDEHQTFSIYRYEQDSHLRKQISSKNLLNRNMEFRIFAYNPDFQDWGLLRIDNVPQEISCIGILTSKQYMQSLERDLSYSPCIYHANDAVFAVFDSEETCAEICRRLGLQKEILSIWPSGGIKIGYNTYPVEALPIINFREAQTEVYVNYNKKSYATPILKISLKELIGTPSIGSVYYIKLPYCAPLQVKIDAFSNNTNPDNEELLGFVADKTSIHIYDKLAEENLLIRGLQSFIHPSLQLDDSVVSNERGFILHKKFFERKGMERRRIR